MEAGRRPFFKDAPLYFSSDLASLRFAGTRLHTIQDLRQALEQIERQNPEVIFVEKKLFLRKIPEVYYQYFQSLDVLMRYVGEHYAVAQEGQYLLALKKK